MSTGAGEGRKPSSAMADFTFCLFVLGCSRFTRNATGTSRVSSACVLRSWGLALITAESCLLAPEKEINMSNFELAFPPFLFSSFRFVFFPILFYLYFIPLPFLFPILSFLSSPFNPFLFIRSVLFSLFSYFTQSPFLSHSISFLPFQSTPFRFASFPST